MEEIVLSSKDSDAFDELSKDRAVLKEQFERMLRYHHNQELALMRSRDELWNHIKESYDLDPKKTYTADYDFKRRRFVVNEKGDDKGDS